MTRQTTLEHYQRRFQILVDYIFQNLGGKLDLDTLAEVACISPYHLHRLYRCLFGETLADTVRRIRLHYAAQALLNSNQPMEHIAKEAGYGSVQAFSRTFRGAFGMPPATFRDQGSLFPFELNPIHSAEGDYPVEITRVEAMDIYGIPHRGDFLDIGQCFERLSLWLGSRQLFIPGTRMTGLYWEDPGSVPEPKLKSLAGVIGLENNQKEELEHHRLPEGDYAVLRFTGPYNHLHQAYQWLFGHWLPHSGYLPGDAPVMEEYINNPREVPPTDLVTDIYLSIHHEETN